MSSKKSTYMKKKKTNSLAKRISNLEAQQSKVETKRFCRNFDGSTFDSDVTNLVNLFSLNKIPRGTGDNNMIGDTVNLKAVGYKLLFHNNDDKAVYIRCAVVRTADDAGIDIAGTDFFKNLDGNALNFASATNTQKFYLPINTTRMDVLDHKLIKVGARNSTYTNQFDSNQVVKMYKEYKNGKKVHYLADQDPAERYYLVWWAILAGMDGSSTNQAELEITGKTTFYYHDA